MEVGASLGGSQKPLKLTRDTGWRLNSVSEIGRSRNGEAIRDTYDPVDQTDPFSALHQ